ncbi:hypothetical protein GIKK_64 [Gordonia phage GiKK]|nr:hypothetical protein GIKK_64 [Gordonia phage GiKK]WKW84855.1 hypothetical protein SEA_JAMZY_64 [Gordonia phage Jamzy]
MRRLRCAQVATEYNCYMNHGTSYTYQKGCRCEDCRAAMLRVSRAYRARRKAGAVMTPRNAELVHGSLSGYRYHHCRCDDCREASRLHRQEILADRRSRPKPDRVHGTANGYGNWGCRCTRCKKAWADYMKKKRAAARDR